MIQFNRSRAALAGAALFLAACSDSPTASARDAEEATLRQQVAALGFRSDMIVDHGDFVLVEGDIYLSKEQLRAATPSSDDPRRPSFQYRTTNLVTSANVNDIRVDVSGLASQPGWQTAAREALTHWSGITDTNVKMIEGGPADITVATTCTSSNVAAYASFPANGNTGPTVYVNTCFGYATSHAQKVHNMVHEFGHTLGFRHSNYTQLGETAGTVGAVHIYGTPTSGNASGSVMNGGTALNSWAGFAASDITATRNLYPLPAASMSVSNYNGYPLVSWVPPSGATSFTVNLITYITENGQYQSRYFTFLASTTGTSYLDSERPYTGIYECEYDTGMGFTQGNWYEYEVVSHFPNGTSSARHYAPVANEGCA